MFCQHISSVLIFPCLAYSHAFFSLLLSHLTFCFLLFSILFSSLLSFPFVSSSSAILSYCLSSLLVFYHFLSSTLFFPFALSTFHRLSSQFLISYNPSSPFSCLLPLLLSVCLSLISKCVSAYNLEGQCSPVVTILHFIASHSYDIHIKLLLLYIRTLCLFFLDSYCCCSNEPHLLEKHIEVKKYHSRPLI